MGFHKHAGNAAGNRCTRQHWHELTLTTALVALAAWLLHRVGGIKYHRTVGFAHDGQATHVRHQRVVAKRSPALTHHDVVNAAVGFFGLVDHLAHIPWCQELAFLDIHRFAGLGTGHNKISLAAQEGWRLQDIDHGCHMWHLLFSMDVSQDRHADLRTHLVQNLQAFFHAKTAESFGGTAVRLVIRRFIDERHTDAVSDLFQLASGINRHLFGFDDTRTRDQKQRMLDTNVKTT